MKPPSTRPAAPEPTEEDVRAYAFHLYQQSGCAHGRDLENWLEAKAALQATVTRSPAMASRPTDGEVAPETLVPRADVFRAGGSRGPQALLLY